MTTVDEVEALHEALKEGIGEPGGKTRYVEGLPDVIDGIIECLERTRTYDDQGELL